MDVTRMDGLTCYATYDILYYVFSMLSVVELVRIWTRFRLEYSRASIRSEGCIYLQVIAKVLMGRDSVRFCILDPGATNQHRDHYVTKRLINPSIITTLELGLLPGTGLYFCDFRCLINIKYLIVRGFVWEQFAVSSEKLISFSYERMLCDGNVSVFDIGFKKILSKAVNLEYFGFDCLPPNYRGLISLQLNSIYIHGCGVTSYSDAELTRIRDLLRTHQASLTRLCLWMSTNRLRLFVADLRRFKIKLNNVHSLYFRASTGAFEVSSLMYFKDRFPKIIRLFYGFDKKSDAACALTSLYFNNDVTNIIYRFVGNDRYDGTFTNYEIPSEFAIFERNFNRHQLQRSAGRGGFAYRTAVFHRLFLDSAVGHFFPRKESQEFGEKILRA